MVESLVARRIDEGAARADLAILERSESDAKRLTRYLHNLPPMPSITAQIDIGERFIFLDSVMQADRLRTRFDSGNLESVPKGLLEPLFAVAA